MTRRIPWLGVPFLSIVAGTLWGVGCSDSSNDDDSARTEGESVTAACSFTVTTNSYDGPGYWGTMAFKNAGTSAVTGYAVDFDIPAGAHCTNDAVPAGAKLSPLTGSGTSAYTTSNHCTFTWTGALAAGASVTFNYSTDTNNFTAASHVVVSSPSCAGPVDAGADATVPSCPTDGGLPDDLRCTGLYSDWTNKTIASGVRAYTPGLVLWSDGADKSRWIWLPAQSKIDTSNMDEWQFPIGTKIWKQFSLNAQIIETRLLWKQTDGTWTYAVYRWSADRTTAKRLETGETNVNGTTYEVPAVRDCPTCHRGRPDAVLGFDLLGTGVAGAQGVTLATLVSEGRLTNPPPSTTIALPEDTTGKAAGALGWLHVNCGVSCHNASPDAKATGTNLFHKILANQLASVESTDTFTTAVNVTGNMTPNGQQYLRIAPGHSAQSLVPLMAAARAPNAGAFSPMPPLVSHVADTAGLKLVNDWIDALRVTAHDAGADVDAGHDAGPPDTGAPDTGAPDTGTTFDAGPIVDSGAPPGTSVLQFHNHVNRDGLYIDSALTVAAAATIHRDTSFNGAIDGHTYSSPLYVTNGPGGHGAFYVATENNNVYALDENTGRPLWQRNVGKAASQSGAGCGGIKPIGITGTPAIDMATRTIVFDAATANSAGNAIQTHTMFGLSIDDGSTRFAIDLSNVRDPSGNAFSPTPQNQRGAILIVNGYAYAVFGGHIGDCNNYHGWVIGVPLDGNASQVKAWRSRVQGAGIWAPAGAVSDGTSIFFTTGNGKGGSGWQDSEAFYRLAPSLATTNRSAEFWVPSNWQDLDNRDLDISGSSPILLDSAGTTPSQLAIVQGKDGNVYLLDRTSMGGLGATPIATANVMSGDISNAAAWATVASGTYIVVRSNLHGAGVGCPSGQSGDLVGIKVDMRASRKLAVAWCADSGGGGSPIITATDSTNHNALVWAAGAEGNNLLRAWNLESGHVVFDGGSASIPNVRHFTIPIAARGRILVGGDGVLYALKP